MPSVKISPSDGLQTVRLDRDHRIDWLRGFALVSIFINHMPGNRFENWTSRNFGFSDAAELFVLLAGVSAAWAFFPRYIAGNQAGAALRALRRAGVLYAAHLASTVAAVAVFALAAWALGDAGIYELIGITRVMDDPWSSIAGLAVGQQQLDFFNILPLYVFLLLVLPAMMWLAARDLRLLLATSAAIYVMAQLIPVRLPNFPADGGWYFNPFAWQLIYVVGFIFGVMRLRGMSVPWHPVAGALAAAYVGYAFVWSAGQFTGPIFWGVLPEWFGTLFKPVLPLSRLLHVLALTYLLVHSRLWAKLETWSPGTMLAKLGRHSLPVFVLGSLLSMVGYIVIESKGSVWWLDTLLTLAGFAAMVALARLIDSGVIRKLRTTAWTSIQGASAFAIANMRSHRLGN